ncbi:MAG: hypothetical protein KGI51_09710 [Rhodospirillales bacterium]|nr:hypothetical protein [Rhodospirillales bacterium]
MTPRDARTALTAETDGRMAEIDRLLNDPSVPIEPERVWSLLAELAERERWGAALRTGMN